jgi:hypothetical protein
MAKLKLKSNDFEYIEGTPEELAIFIKISENKSIIVSNTSISSITKNEIRKDENIDIIPKEEDIYNFIITKDFFEHNTIELQEKFLKRRIPVRENITLYNSFDNLIRKVRRQIAVTYKGKWDKKTKKSYSAKTHVIIYKFIKQE